MSQHNRANERRTSDGEHGGAQDNDDRTADTVGPGAGDLSSELGILSALIAASAGNGQGGHGGISRDGQQGGSISIHDLIRFLVSNRGSTTTGGPVIHFDEDEEDGDYVPGEHDDDDEYEDEEDDEDEDDYQDEGYSYWGRRHFNNVGHHFPRVTEPQAAGLKLLYSGEFGPPPPGPVVNAKPEEPKSQSRRATRRTRRPLEQEPAPEANQYPAYHTAYRLPLLPIRKPFAPHNSRAETARGLVPNSPGAVVAQYEDKVYSGQFSLDANIFYSCTQGHDIWVYDANSTGNKKIVDPTTGVASRMKILNRLSGVYGNWTVTDSHLSPDNERLIYSSISPIVYLTKLQEPGAQHVPLDFSGTSRRGRRGVFYDDTFGIWTCRFSADGKEVVACGSQQIFVWDLAANKRIVNIPAHQQDVNSCCWADTSSGNILVSGSDDAMIKVWDRRSLSSNRPSGVLPGHLEGITSVSAKGDGRYIISNGKDHALRLWDLRNMREHEDVDYRPHGQRGYDYRYGGYRKPKKGAHPNDCSVMTYRGHSVFRTLIRCHFSPAETTGQAYVYSGSTDGKVYIWSLDGRIVETIDRTQSLPISFDSRDPDLPERTQHNRGHNDKIIRDCSWHPREPALLSCYWDSGESSSIARHEWKSLGKRGMTLEDVMEKNRAEAEERERMARLPGHYEL